MEKINDKDKAACVDDSTSKGKQLYKVTLILSKIAIDHIEEVAKRNDMSVHAVADFLLRRGNIVPLVNDIAEIRSKSESKSK